MMFDSYVFVAGIREMFQNYKFVGCCTESLALIQYRVSFRKFSVFHE